VTSPETDPDPAARPLPAGVGAALLAAALFGASAPLAKALLTGVGPWMLAGLLYLGSGLGLMLLRFVRRSPSARLERGEWPWLAGAVLAGGVVGPVLLMFGLSGMPASGASLLLNAEGVFTALLAWFAFKENFDRRIALGMVAIVAGAVVLSWPGEARIGSVWPALAVLGACLAWGLDNNLTRKVSLADATWMAMVKGLAAGSVNLVIALTLGASLPRQALAGSAVLLGFFAYGISLTLFVVALRHLGTARTGAYFSVAPFFGAVARRGLARRAGDAGPAGRGRADGAGRVAAPQRAARPPAHARGRWSMTTSTSTTCTTSTTRPTSRCPRATRIATGTTR
jgi:drug/metabolite transporter (DMT)-like permease